MEMIQVTSSTINAIGYDDQAGTLRVEFIKSGTYDYYSVSQDIYYAFLSAPSKGQFHNLYIKKGGFSYSRV
ncbi:KTSC domain-containing protein [Dyadobacter subterraneus]|uniref:KTSC domain-containing protein n=1 Tax=Dyadobacter subterraneus TaxID=2773304 RepID=A0ABR9W563_9BACT|nr:KTSC domain-containing protein [Dyadobacter subterraneus]MBE9460595.1 KTSC domain-containing protein [Dyadobacter subterraneus]